MSENNAEANQSQQVAQVASAASENQLVDLEDRQPTLTEPVDTSEDTPSLEEICEALVEKVVELNGKLVELSEKVVEQSKQIAELREEVQKFGQQLGEIGHSAKKEKRRPSEPDPAPSVSLWFAGDVWRDVRLTWRMFRDPGYRVAWSTVLLIFFALVYLTIWPAIRAWLGWGWSIPVVSYVDNLIVAYLGLKGLSRELGRYEYYLANRGEK